MKKFIAALIITAVVGLAGCSLPVAAPAPLSDQESVPATTAASDKAPVVKDPGFGDSGMIVQRPAPGSQTLAPASPTMSVEEVCAVWKQGFRVIDEGIVSAGEAMTPLEEATAAAPPEIRVQSGIATRILWGQILYPSDQPASAETMGYLAALRQACYDLTGIDVVEGLDK